MIRRSEGFCSEVVTRKNYCEQVAFPTAFLHHVDIVKNMSKTASLAQFFRPIVVSFKKSSRFDWGITEGPSSSPATRTK
jgi:hypothetical protein